MNFKFLSFYLSKNIVVMPNFFEHDQICEYCIYGNCDNFCGGCHFKSVVSITPNFPSGTTSRNWKLGFLETSFLVILREKSRCYICNKKLTANERFFHHLRRKSYGGSNHPRNLILLCKNCYSKKNQSLGEKLEIRRTRIDFNKKFWEKLI